MPERVLVHSAKTVSDALAFLEAEARSLALDAQTVDRILLVAGEAVANVFEHGLPDPEAGVRISLRFDRAALELLVSDGGDGPDPFDIARAALPDPESTEGRGLFLMNELADEIRQVGRALAFRFVVPAE